MKTGLSVVPFADKASCDGVNNFSCLCSDDLTPGLETIWFARSLGSVELLFDSPLSKLNFKLSLESLVKWPFSKGGA